MSPLKKYIYVWDREKDRILLIYYIKAPDLKDVPKTTHGGIDPAEEEKYFAQLNQQYPEPRYFVDGGYSYENDGESAAKGLISLAFSEMPTDENKRFLCVWDVKEQKLVEAYLVDPGAKPAKGVKALDPKDEDSCLKALKDKYPPYRYITEFMGVRSAQNLVNNFKILYPKEYEKSLKAIYAKN